MPNFGAKRLRVTAPSYLLASIIHDLTPPVCNVRFYILIAVMLKITDFCYMTSYSLLETYQSSLPAVYPEYRGRTFLRDAVTLVPDYTALYKEPCTFMFFLYRALWYNYVMLTNKMRFLNQCFNSALLDFYVFRTSYVHLQEVRILYTALYDMFFMHETQTK
jgi:hypothetical protein